ncbi:MAG TPA: NAD-binding protein [Baekduia sp.]|nr:NAD-binding protein [Baekduia sp.]
MQPAPAPGPEQFEKVPLSIVSSAALCATSWPAGIEVVVVCSRPDCSSALAATAAGTRLVIGNAGEADVWRRAGLREARAVGLLGADDLQNLSAALLVAEEKPDTQLVVRMFSAELAGGISRVLGERATVMSETEVAAPAFLQAALSGNTGQRVTIAGQVLEVAEVDADDPRLVVALCNASTPTDVLPPRAALDPVVLGLIDPDGLVLGARGAFPPTVACTASSASAAAPPLARVTHGASGWSRRCGSSPAGCWCCSRRS